MWLLDTKNITLEFLNEAQVLNHPYAILSHVWGHEEVLWHEVRDDRTAIQSKAGWEKIIRFCATAAKYGFAYAWVDTCCIDKRSSADLTEAINSMYKYYHDAAVCFIYLEDVHKCIDKGSNAPPGATTATRDQLLSAVRTTKWISRGWTLQELLAPSRRCFFAADWSEIEEGGDLLDVLAETAEISRQLIEDRSLLRSFCIAERMRWASKRNVTRGEDVAYSLMGLFDVHMPVMYGEGAEVAFRRLQREIMQSSFDMTIFAWRADYESSGFLARSPADFADVPRLELWAPWNLAPFSSTNVGLSIRLNITNEQQILDANNQHHRKFEELPKGVTLVAALQCDVQTPTGQWQIPMVYLEPVKGARFFINGRNLKAYRRIRCAEWMTIPSEQLVGCPFEDILVLHDEQYELVRRATQQHYSRREPCEEHGRY
ncbi:HET-domain-containing protein [Annulohypoxylon truncatum]|uniref:HET-domain-containing protein n=1 Tax=Annulohypoxylon truncatum TaxID=327061 RepID=UPI002007AE7F|nr:HET-domain-containing protein [Annulohypoxylon truncatum]KAI1208061.1 HET-domain-containing protein [Annulohypoxylon truncatum]